MNNNYLKTSSMDNILSYLFYTNVQTMHDKNVFWNILGETFLACDVLVETCPFHCKLSNLPSITIGLHYKILVKKKMLVELCEGYYETLYGFMNGANGIFEDFAKNISKKYFGYIFIILRLDTSWINNLQIYEEFLRLWQKIDTNWT